ncbi:penicillin-binding protein 2 [Candidatus Gracilibacteria bacterium]|nr:penicillin-binding protein 2 [Candidatus Gracilibacteria bacterium]NJM86391.1 penicillin-binding protein 2 [Hydrococcus sp. RU_2_2]
MVVASLGLGWRLYQLQILQASELQQKAKQQQTIGVKPYIPRRSIIDSQGNVLATDRLVYALFVHPKLFSLSKEEIAKNLAQILSDRTPQELLEQFNKRDTGILIAADLPEDTAEQIRQLRFDGIELNEKYSRFYPQQEAIAEAIGYVDRDYKGQAGVESSQRNLIKRDSLQFPIRRDGQGTIIPASLPQKNLNFDRLQLQLTLDLRLQRAARSSLKQQLAKYNAKRGAVIVMDATDGSLLSLVCEPTYNPNRYQEYNVELFKNWTVADLYEPGSTFKPINIAIALEAGAIQPNTYFYDDGSITVDGWNIFNATREKNGSLSLARVLQTSSNIAMVQMMSRLNRKDYYQDLKNLGIAEKIGIDLPGDAAGHLKSKEEFTAKAIESATASFGQGFSLTPMKLVQLQAALANGGKLVTPHVVKGLVDTKGQFHWKPTFTNKTVFSPQTSQAVVEMMETVVAKGTGKPAKIPGYRIGGKTGTAQKAGATGGYIPGAKITSFVAILPVEAPRYVVLVVVDEPKGGNTFGSTVAAPVAKSVMEALISLQGIPPSQKIEPEQLTSSP